MKLKVRINFTFAILIILIPLTGFPNGVKYIAITASAIVICLTTYLIHRQLRYSQPANKKRTVVTEAFVESGFDNSHNA